MLVAVAVLFTASLGYAQPEQVDVLGAHQNQGRGCAGCHTPHSGARGSGQATTDATSGNTALWGQDVSVLYGKTFQFGDYQPWSNYNETLPADMSKGIGDAETGGLLLCLSCHDGSLTPQNMMANQAYEQKIGLLPAVYGKAANIPTLLGVDGTTATYNGANFRNDHPVGQKATIVPEDGSGLVWDATNGSFSVTPGSEYAQFVANYGWPALAPGKWSAPYGVLPNKSAAFVVCTTCHDQHLMTVYTSVKNGTVNPSNSKVYGSEIAGDGGGQHYATYFFVRGPYNIKANTATSTGGGQASSTTQFCRQCHFGESNEANGITGITTKFNQ
jgi:cytochrome c553